MTGVQTCALPISSGTLYADLSTATASTINAIRYAFQIQKLLEKDARGGTRYSEMIMSHYGVSNGDARLQRPEFLGGCRFPINVQQVLSTAGAAADATTKLGQPGANSVTGYSGHLFTKSFTEFGFLYVLAVARQHETYSQGLHKMFSRKKRFDYYYPVLAHIGEQPVYKKEIMFVDNPCLCSSSPIMVIVLFLLSIISKVNSSCANKLILKIKNINIFFIIFLFSY